MLEATAAAQPAKWTKKDIKELCGHLDTFRLLHRPLDFRGRAAAAAQMLKALAEPRHRKDVVLAGIRSARARLQERYRSSCETIGNQLVRFTEYGQPDDLIARFIGIAREEDAADKKLEKTLYRLLAEDLPPEVLAYDPTAPR